MHCLSKGIRPKLGLTIGKGGCSPLRTQFLTGTSSHHNDPHTGLQKKEATALVHL